MSIPLHEIASRAVVGPTDAIRAQLTDDPYDLVAVATADALTAMTPALRAWGLAPTEVPTAEVDRVPDDAPGILRVRWRGDEDRTGWPQLEAALMLVPTGAAQARLHLLTPRSPAAELATLRLDHCHRRRLVHTALRRFLDAVAVAVHDPVVPSSGRSSGGDGTTTPLHVHHVRPVDVDPWWLRATLTEAPGSLAAAVTADVVERTRADRARGRFLRDPAPTVGTHPHQPGELPALTIGWRDDEDATGWPSIDLHLLVEAALDGGAVFGVLSTRPAGYDVSRNRPDKHARDAVLRRVGAEVVDAVLDRLTSGATTMTNGPTPADDLPERVAVRMRS